MGRWAILRAKLHSFWFPAGLAAVLCMAVPYCILGQDAIVVYHDQLDGELIAYLLQAKHLFDGDALRGVLPEFLGGASVTALIPPAPAFVLLFLGGNGFPGLALMQLLGSLCGYLGMYLLVKRETDRPFIAMAVGLLYGYLPFLPVYGLAQYGLPLLLFCVLEAGEGRHRAAAFGYGCIYALASSLVLVGFGVLFVMALWILRGLVIGKRLEKRVGIRADKRAGIRVDIRTDIKTEIAAEMMEKTTGVTDNKNGRVQSWLNPLIMWCIMLCIYVAENYRLLAQTLGMGGGAGPWGSLSHKTEYVLSPENFLNSFFTALARGGQHSEDFHGIFLGAAVLAAVCFLALNHAQKARTAGAVQNAYKVQDVSMMQNAQKAQVAGAVQNAPKVRKLLLLMGVCLGWNVFFALVAAVWNAEPGILLRSRLQVLGAFQMDRFLWIAPCFWYLILACALALAAEWRESMGERFPAAGAVEGLRQGASPRQAWRGGFGRYIVGAVPGICMAAVLCATGARVFLAGNLKPNIQKLRNPGYSAMSFKDYYGIGVLSQVEDFLAEYGGESKEDYRVASLGIDPAAALYHGFYCLDGYSNNYSLEYKHAFRRIIAPELAKSEYLTDYFDSWGNRCYLFSAECPGYYTIEKGGFFFQDYSLDTEALRELGGKYLFSAAYIANAGEQGLVLLREEPFETADSYYRIYVYGIR